MLTQARNIARIGAVGFVTTLTGGSLPAAPKGDTSVNMPSALAPGHTSPPFKDRQVRDGSARDIAPKLPPREAEVAPEPAVQSTNELGATLKRNLLSLLAPAFAMTSMGWYYRQLRARETFGSFTTSALAVVNGSILLGSALLTPGQGVGTPLLYGTNLAFNLLIGRELWSQRKVGGLRQEGESSDSILFSATEKACAGAASVGMASLLASNLPAVQQLLSQDTLLIASKVIAIGVGVVITVPLMTSAFARPKPGEEIEVVGSRWRSVAKPVLPYIVGSTAVALAGISAEQYTLSTLLAPIAMTLHNVVLTAGVVTWAWRRTAE